MRSGGHWTLVEEIKEGYMDVRSSRRPLLAGSFVLAPLSFSEDRQLIKYSGRRARARLSFLLVGGVASNRGSIEGEDLE